MCTNCKAETSHVCRFVNCGSGYLCGVWSCQLAETAKSDFIHAQFECLWRNSLVRAGNLNEPMSGFIWKGGIFGNEVCELALIGQKKEMDNGRMECEERQALGLGEGRGGT